MFPGELLTPRLRLRRPHGDDAEEVFRRYAADPEVTRYLSWPTHRSVDDTRVFLRSADQGWQDGSNLPYMIERLADGVLLGSTGLHAETPGCYSTGYVLARDAWGQGYATEALAAMLALAFARPDVTRVYALCDAEHRASARVLEKCGMEREGLRRAHTVLPNLSAHPRDMLCYSRGRPVTA
jgi:[ribosomal protein S5]-alanine N-acetyltransferase